MSYQEENLHCDCGLNWTPARVEKIDRTPDDYVRCVGCKKVHSRPMTNNHEGISAETLEQLTEIASSAYAKDQFENQEENIGCHMESMKAAITALLASGEVAIVKKGGAVLKFPKNFCWEMNGQLAELIKQAEECLPHLEENSVGYYYFWMLQVLKETTAAKADHEAELGKVRELVSAAQNVLFGLPDEVLRVDILALENALANFSDANAKKQDEVEHYESCECCGNFHRMEEKYDALLKEAKWAMTLIKFSIRPGVCVSRGDDQRSAIEIYESLRHFTTNHATTGETE